MTPRWSVRIVILGDRYAVDLERRAETVRRARLSTHATRAEAEAARVVVRRDPGAHWRDPIKRGPRAERVRWSVEQRRAANGRIVITGNTGIINITIPANVTSTLDFTQAVYDLKGTSPSGVVTRYLSGLVTFSKAVTR